MLYSLASSAQDPSTLLVVLMGIGIVFVGLVCIVFICSVSSAVVRSIEKPGKNASAVASPAVAAPAPAATPAAIANKQELIAAISVAIAEDLGEDVSAIRILSIKKTA